MLRGMPSRPARSYVGDLIRTRRRALDLTLAEVARKTEFSVSYLSQVERNLVGPSVAALMKIAAALGVSVGEILARDERSSAGAKLVRPQDRKTLSYPGSDIRYELLSPDLANRAMEVLMFRAPAGSTSGAEPFAHDGEECFVLIKGRLRVWVGEEEHVMREGDSLYFKSSMAHRWVNDGKTDALAIWVNTPPSF
jgi:transcriptional regulator with XRE-family HTH domain